MPTECAAAAARADSFAAIPLTSVADDQPIDDEELNITDLRNSLTSLMWRNVGIRRDAESLDAALSQVEFWDRYVGNRTFNSPAGWELQNMLLVSRLMIQSAAQRCESRGVHFRSDFPETDSKQSQHISIAGCDD